MTQPLDLEALEQPLKDVRAAYSHKPHRSVEAQLEAKGFIIKTKQKKERK